MRKITTYTTATCAYCHMLKDYLEKNNVAFIEKRADTDPKLAEELVAESGQMGVPFTIIEDNGEKETVLGFDRSKLDQVLEL